MMRSFCWYEARAGDPQARTITMSSGMGRMRRMIAVVGMSRSDDVDVAMGGSITSVAR